ncbi:hypothetical protein L1887_57730 [Cichorium endivia]|nr:hypothetical protein L1887_57730 [Cichorium endivia]
MHWERRPSGRREPQADQAGRLVKDRILSIVALCVDSHLVEYYRSVRPIWELQQAQRKVRTAQRIRFDSRHAHERDSVSVQGAFQSLTVCTFFLAQAAALANGRVGRLSARGSQGTHSSFKSAHPAFVAAHSLSSRLADVCAAECHGSPVCDASSLERKDIVRLELRQAANILLKLSRVNPEAESGGSSRVGSRVNVA